MRKKVLFLSLTVTWGLAVVFAYYIGLNEGARHAKREFKKARRQARKKQSRRFSPGDSDPRGNR